MPRQPRQDHEGAVHHVFGRGNDQRLIYRDEEDYGRFLHKLATLAEEFGVELIAYCLMPNHYHMILRTGAIPLSRFMHRLLTSYAVSFNQRWGTVGHPFQGRFKNRLCRDDNDLRGLVRYVHMNPVKANLVADVDDWMWSSHRVCVGLSGLPGSTSRIASLFEDDIEAYREFLRQQPVAAETPSLLELAKEAGLVQPFVQTPEAVATRRQFAGLAVSAGFRRSDVARYLGQTRGAVSRLLRE